MPCDPDHAHRAGRHRAIKRAKKPARVAMSVGAASSTREPFEEAA